MTTTPRWMKATLVAAGIYNLAWGAVAVLAPSWIFDLVGMELPRYPQLWQCIGMIVGVYGIGYIVAAPDPARHWPIVLVGFLGKVFGPIGFMAAVLRDQLPWSFGATILTNDIIWWVPFTLILWHAARAHGHVDRDASAPDPTAVMRETVTNTGQTLYELSLERPRLLVFLRHIGCTFCREALADLRDASERLEQSGTSPVLVHMSDDADAGEFFARYGLDDVPRVSDPERRVYESFELQRGTFRQLFGPRVWWRGLRAGLAGHGIGALAGDGFQMPGAFVIHDGNVVRVHRHESAADRPDYCDLVTSSR